MSKVERIPMVSRSFSKDTVNFKDMEGKVLWSKIINGTAGAKDLVNAISEFTDKYWDKKTPWLHSVSTEFVFYEMEQSKFIDLALKIEGEELQKRIEQINKNREKRNK